MTPDQYGALALFVAAVVALAAGVASIRAAGKRIDRDVDAILGDRRQDEWDRHADSIVRDESPATARIPAQRRPS
jgi:hypothetical protein